MLKISIIEGHHQPQSRTTKNGMRYYQEGYAHMGGAFPQQIEIPLRNPAEANPVGEYTLDISTFQVGRFKNLELNPFELRLVPAQKILSKAS
ncbi:single-stranded DNA-binding protein [Teredinibacter turnerae]|uniref:single-stranded DNA-binding protein n=1 Tax=Teredinibacter turnerae TaxID=2426 RepID=UPI000362C3F3|nr:single-stranded DNA-binding protein [Teredinibacter turnerae]